ncbi:hypothetical protein [Streptomyces sp. CAI-17]|uniref:hypothetical protein n=1 Tax=Streptomyces sp. CAI-17 TaxID=1169742 RepID=UPI0015951A95|nr:hypothetical protein [Streptomyces sp. CAI-17]
MKYSTPAGGTVKVTARLFGRSTVTCSCGFTRTLPDRNADALANRHAGSCRRGTPDRARRAAPGSIGTQR